jgi:hypothetical protein
MISAEVGAMKNDVARDVRSLGDEVVLAILELSDAHQAVRNDRAVKGPPPPDAVERVIIPSELALMEKGNVLREALERFIRAVTA